MNSAHVLVVDLETTGFLEQGGLIVEIGAVSLDLSSGSIEYVWDTLVRESSFDDSHSAAPFGWIFSNSDLTPDMIYQAPLSADVFPDFQDLLNQYPAGVIAYNNSFDFGFLRSRGFSFHGLPCPMRLATDVCKIPFSSRSGYKWPSAEEAHQFLCSGLGYSSRHRAADDAFHEAQIVWELYQQGVYSVSDDLSPPPPRLAVVKDGALEAIESEVEFVSEEALYPYLKCLRAVIAYPGYPKYLGQSVKAKDRDYLKACHDFAIHNRKARLHDVEDFFARFSPEFTSYWTKGIPDHVVWLPLL